MPLLLLLLPFCMLLQDGLHSRLRSVHTHTPQANQLPQWSKVLSKFAKNHKLYVSVSTYLVTNSHVGFTCIVSVVKINFLTMILESKPGCGTPLHCWWSPFLAMSHTLVVVWPFLEGDAKRHQPVHGTSEA